MIKKVCKIIKITGFFFAFLLVVSYLWFLIESNISPEINNVVYMDYLLYLLGYGDLEIPDLYGKSFFSIIGLRRVYIVNQRNYYQQIRVSLKTVQSPHITLR